MFLLSEIEEITLWIIAKITAKLIAKIIAVSEHRSEVCNYVIWHKQFRFLFLIVRKYVDGILGSRRKNLLIKFTRKQYAYND